jgi:hypothetical protein
VRDESAPTTTKETAMPNVKPRRMSLWILLAALAALRTTPARADVRTAMSAAEASK